MSVTIYNEKYASEIAADLLKVEAIKLNITNPFQWASGWNSPIYCDNRVSLGFPEVRERITEYLCDLIKSKYPSVEAIAGVATAGIPQGALIAAKLGLPFLYVRSKAKGHGMTNLIEGKVVKGQKVVVIEDLISTGGSSLKAVADLRASEIDVLGMAAIFTYDFSVSVENFEQNKVELSCLSDYNFLITEAKKVDYIKEDDIPSLKSWRENPSIWGK